MKKGIHAWVSVLFLTVILSPAVAQMNHKMGHQTEGETKIVDGIKGRLKVTPAMGMLDLYLTDAKTGEVISGAKVKATMTMPGGKKIEKDLPGMKMGETYSYMNTLDLSSKGVYTFDITAEVKERVSFSFTYEVR